MNKMDMWKQKTKAVGLATVIGATAAFAGVAGSATPASASTKDVDEGTTLCKAEYISHLSDGDISGTVYILITNEVYVEVGCQGFIHDADGYSDSYLVTPGIYSYHSQCNEDNMARRVLTEAACNHGSLPVITMTDYNNPDTNYSLACLFGAADDKLYPVLACRFDYDQAFEYQS